MNNWTNEDWKKYYSKRLSEEVYRAGYEFYNARNHLHTVDIDELRKTLANIAVTILEGVWVNNG